VTKLGDILPITYITTLLHSFEFLSMSPRDVKALLLSSIISSKRRIPSRLNRVVAPTGSQKRPTILTMTAEASSVLDHVVYCPLLLFSYVGCEGACGYIGRDVCLLLPKQTDPRCVYVTRPRTRPPHSINIASREAPVPSLCTPDRRPHPVPAVILRSVSYTTAFH
jgi:hypothetical protein